MKRLIAKMLALSLFLSIPANAGLFDDLGTLLKGDSSSAPESEAPPSTPSPTNPSNTRSPSISDKRIALVIGNSSYTNSPLKNPVNDAKDIASKLRKLGFDVIERTNLKTKQIGATLREFRSKLTPGATALVFYAGHGLQIKGINYLPAVDADINSEEDVPNQSLAMSQIMDVLDESKSRLNLVFLDACRNNPYARSFRSADRGLARVSAPSGTLISYATRPGSVAADGDGHNGLYTSKLLAQMDSKQQIEQILKRVVTEVKTASQGKQEPWMEGSIEGDFCFGGCATVIGGGTQVASLEAVAIPASARIKNKDEIEQETWESARSSANIGAIQEYLKQYPKGRFVGQAKVLIATLNTTPIKPSEPAASAQVRDDGEAALWAEVQKGNTAQDYRAYLGAYPNGKYVPLAKSRMGQMASDAVQQAKLRQDSASQQSEQLELAAWKKAQNNESEASIQGYLSQYPNGRHMAEAKRQLAQIVTARQAIDNKSGGCVFPSSKNVAPDWVCSASIDGVVVSAVGFAEKSAAGDAFMRAFATASAREELVRSTKVWLANSLKQYFISNGTQSLEKLDQAISKANKTITSNSLTDAKIYKVVYSPDGNVYVLLGLSGEAITKINETHFPSEFHYFLKK